MSYPAQTLIRNAHTALQDADGVHWPATELVDYLNDGQRVLTTVRPDANVVTAPFAPLVGARQQLPTSAIAFIDIPRNSAGKRKALRKVDMATLDSVVPEWQSMAGSTEFAHFMYDLRDPRTFYLYPPAKAGGSVELVTANYPTDVSTPSGPTAASVTGNIGVLDQWADALLAYVLFRAFAKDSEFASNVQFSAGYLAAFNAATGAQLQAAQAVEPSPTQ